MHPNGFRNHCRRQRGQCRWGPSTRRYCYACPFVLWFDRPDSFGRGLRESSFCVLAKVPIEGQLELSACGSMPRFAQSVPPRSQQMRLFPERKPPGPEWPLGLRNWMRKALHRPRSAAERVWDGERFAGCLKTGQARIDFQTRSSI